MLRNKTLLKAQLQQMSRGELEEMLVKLAGKRFNYEFLLVHYLEPEEGEQMLYDETIESLDRIFEKKFNGRSAQHQGVKRLTACIKRIDEFTEETRNKALEANLLMYLLKHEFRTTPTLLGAKTGGYDYKIALLIKRVIKLVDTKMHPDYKADYTDSLNEMLHQLHSVSNRVNTVRQLPLELE